MTNPQRITIDKIVYVREDSVQQPPAGDRCVVVVDRGWMYAGDVTDENGRVRLSRAVHIQKFTGGIWFGGMLKNPDSEHVHLQLVPGGVVDIPAGSEIFRVPVADDWGL